MSHAIPNTTAIVVITAPTEPTASSAGVAPVSSSDGPQTKRMSFAGIVTDKSDKGFSTETTGSLAVIAAGPVLVIAQGCNIPKTPTTPTKEAAAKAVHTSKGGQEKPSLMKRISGRFERSPSPSAMESLVLGVSRLSVVADHGEMNKLHQRQSSSVTDKPAYVKTGKEAGEADEEEYVYVDSDEGDDDDDDDEDDVETPSSTVNGPDYIHCLGVLRGGPVRSNPTSPAERAKRQKQKPRSFDQVIARHHPTEKPPSVEERTSLLQRWEALSEDLQHLVQYYGGNTYNSILQVISLVESHPFSIHVVRKTEHDYKSKKPRENRGVKGVYCLLCNDGTSFATMGRAAAHLTETHWKLKPWRVERFPHPDKRWSGHTKACSDFWAQIGQGQASTCARTLDITERGAYNVMSSIYPGQGASTSAAASSSRRPPFDIRTSFDHDHNPLHPSGSYSYPTLSLNSHELAGAHPQAPRVPSVVPETQLLHSHNNSQSFRSAPRTQLHLAVNYTPNLSQDPQDGSLSGYDASPPLGSTPSDGSWYHNPPTGRVPLQPYVHAEQVTTPSPSLQQPNVTTSIAQYMTHPTSRTSHGAGTPWLPAQGYSSVMTGTSYPLAEAMPLQQTQEYWMYENEQSYGPPSSLSYHHAQPDHAASGSSVQLPGYPHQLDPRLNLSYYSTQLPGLAHGSSQSASQAGKANQHSNVNPPQ
ncbi:hypothetical protein PIIN_05571 [Serendipita indica DSM 11827]|uniref:Uncharacterized protein n=1 Tax=Serendipita indica (strain DSM 11827) TaxID=1109443 RepID=G4TJZ8_SERID|nr:hypothetical protein PIIN_05571 [Serendipita indica DSM 11827]